jgi:5-deoxy-D-glucuronate isomerase
LIDPLSLGVSIVIRGDSARTAETSRNLAVAGATGAVAGTFETVFPDEVPLVAGFGVGKNRSDRLVQPISTSADSTKARIILRELVLSTENPYQIAPSSRNRIETMSTPGMAAQYPLCG